MIATLWFPALLVGIGIIWLIMVLFSLGKPRPPRRRVPGSDDRDSIIPFTGDDPTDDGHHGLH